jgi:hypothetical protein
LTEAAPHIKCIVYKILTLDTRLPLKGKRFGFSRSFLSLAVGYETIKQIDSEIKKEKIKSKFIKQKDFPGGYL